MRPLRHKILISLVLLTNFTQFSFADDKQKKALEEGKKFGNQNLNKVKNTSQSGAEKYKVPGYQDGKKSQEQYYSNSSSLKNDANSKGRNSNAAKFISESGRKRPKVSAKELAEWTKNGLNIQKNPKNSLNLSGEYGACKTVPKGGSSTITFERRCDEGQTAKKVNQSCTAYWQVEAESKYLYACNKTQTYSDTKTCHEWRKVKCTGEKACNNLSAVVSITAPFTRATGSGYFGRYGDDYHDGECKFFNRVYSVNISDIRIIHSFVIGRMTYDDWVQLRVNGKFVFQKPYGSILSPKWGDDQIRVYPGSGYIDCERDDQVAYLNIDIKPFLRNGNNTLYFTHVVEGSGDMAVDFRITGSCCAGYKDTLKNNCRGL